MIHPQLFYQHQACCKNTCFLSQQSLNSKCQGVKILCGWVKFKASELQVTWSNLMCWIILRTRFASIYDVLYFNVLCWIYDVVYKLLYLQINDSLVFAPENPKRLGSLPSKLAKVPVPDSWHDSTSWILRKSPRVWGFKWVSSFEYPRPKHPKNGVNSCLSLVGFWADLMQKIAINHLAMASSILVDPICSSFIPGWSPPKKKLPKTKPPFFCCAKKKKTQNHRDPPNWEMAAGCSMKVLLWNLEVTLLFVDPSGVKILDPIHHLWWLHESVTFRMSRSLDGKNAAFVYIPWVFRILSFSPSDSCTSSDSLSKSWQ